ncbi:MAG: hypothetical protein ACTSWW_07240 [Promethearchaeota archaeon]
MSEQLIWSQVVIIDILACIPMIITVILALRHYRRDRYPHLKFYAAQWVFWVIWELFQAISDLLVFNPTLSKSLHLVCFYALILMGFSAIFFIDTITRGSIDPWKIFIMSITSTAVIIFSFDVETAVTIKTVGDIQYPTMDGAFRIANLIMMVWVVIVVSYGNLKILLHTPKKLRTSAWWNVIGVFIYLIFPLIVQFIHLEDLFPGIANLSMAFGMVITSITLLTKPQLAFVLPFEAYRIIVVDTTAGMAIYKHEFTSAEEKFSENIFSGVIKAISTLFDQTINKGRIREIQMEDATLILNSQTGSSLATVLIANKSSPSLHTAFEAFTAKLLLDHLKDYSYSQNLDKYKFINILVSNYFSFIPERT